MIEKGKFSGFFVFVSSTVKVGSSVAEGTAC